jgi:hypothetical protein
MSTAALASTYAPPAELAGRRQRFFVLGGVGAAVLIAGAFVNPGQFFRSYLVAFLFWFGIALGSLALQMLHHLTRGAWGIVIRRVLEAAARTMPFVALLFLPIVFGMDSLYSWTDAAKVQADHLLAHKAPYLNKPFFLVRAAILFVIWSVIAYQLSKWSRLQDETGDKQYFHKMQALSGGGLVLYCLTVTVAAVDWLMSLDPHWFSSLYGVYWIGCQGVATLAFVALVNLYLVRREPLEGVLQPRHFHDLGKLLFAFVMLWTYFCLSQFLIIWSGSLPEETLWYAHRLHGGWNVVAVAILLFHFALPFLLLLSRDIKRNAAMLSRVALVLLVMRFVDTYWQAAPNFHSSLAEALRWSWMDVAAVLGLGGIWLGLFFWQLGTRPLLPARDPYFAEALEAGGHHG